MSTMKHMPLAKQVGETALDALIASYFVWKFISSRELIALLISLVPLATAIYAISVLVRWSDASFRDTFLLRMSSQSAATRNWSLIMTVLLVAYAIGDFLFRN